MSLINDALRRVRDAQPPPVPTTPPPPPHFRPVEPVQRTRRSVGILVPVCLVLLALLGLFFCWRLTRPVKQSRGLVAQAKSYPIPSTTPVAAPRPAPLETPAPTPPAPAPQPGAAAAVARPEPVASPVTTAAPQPAPASETAAIPQPAILPGTTNSAETLVTNVVADTPSVRLPTLRLQGIIFNPSRPSAVVNGKPVFVGDRVGDYRVRRITPDTVTLVAPGRTNLLSLED